MTLTLYPALDIRAGQVVRLRQGDYAQQTSYAVDPVAQATDYARHAEWLHLVDLDAARLGGWTLAPLVERIAAVTGLRVQTGGGVRSRADVERILGAGASRVVVGSLALREPETVTGWIGEFGAEAITVALDARPGDDGWSLPAAGWTQDSGASLADLVARYVDAGARHVLATDISRDGMASGPGLELYAELTRLAPTLAIQASGGIRDADDIVAAREAGCAGVVLGRSLLEGTLTLADAQEATR